VVERGSDRGWERLRIYVKREADLMRRLPERGTTSVAGSSRARLAIDSGHFANAAGPEWNVPCPWHDHFCHGHRQQHDVTSLRFRGVPPPCCGLPSWCFLICCPKNVGHFEYGPQSRIRNPAMMVKQRRVMMGTRSRFCRHLSTW